MKSNKPSRLHNLLLYLSNNENISKKQWEADEVKFDIGFLIALFISIFLAMVCWVTSVTLKVLAVHYGNAKMESIGSVLSDGGWIFIAIIFFIEAYDSLRHNRTWGE
jgi:hypothetical protein